MLYIIVAIVSGSFGIIISSVMRSAGRSDDIEDMCYNCQNGRENDNENI